jgi:hypothetical protein
MADSASYPRRKRGAASSLTIYVRRNLKIMAMNLINVCQQVAAIHLVESFDAACQIPPE